MLTIKKLNINFASKTVIKDSSLKIFAKDHVQITGPSGVGKSSILKAIIQFIPTPSTQIYLEDQRLAPEHIDQYRQNFAYIGQKAPYYAGSVIDFLQQPFQFKRNSNKELPPIDELQNLLTSLGFKSVDLNQAYNSLSGGEQQRISIAQALLLKRKIYLLDEITSALDPINTALIIDIFRKMKETTFILVSHDLEWNETINRRFSIENHQLAEVKS